MAKNLRTFLKEYKAKYPEDVVHIDKEISSVQQITSIAIQFEKQEKYPLLIFHNVLNAEGKKAKHWLATNVLASRTRYARICNSTFRTLGRDVYEATRVKRKSPVVVSKGEAPVKEVVKTGGQVNLFEFPATVHNALDAGYYFSSAFTTCYDPDSGVDNSALLRGWIKEKDTVRITMGPRPGHTATNVYKHELKNQDMKVALWLGHHPLAYIGGLTKLPYPGSHWEAIGGMLAEPLRLVGSESLGDDFLVPADAEVIVEGFLEANKRYAEGPFGEFTGYYGGQIIAPQMKVTAVTHRKEAIWYDIVAGWADHTGTGGASIEGQLWEALKPRFPSLQNVYMPLSGSRRFHAYLQFKNPRPGEARQAIMLACAVQPIFVKHVFAVDDDIDIFDEKEVMWAIATRSQWDGDVMIFPRARRPGLDPSIGSGALYVPGGVELSTSGGIDCTKPWGEPFEERVGVDQEVLDKTKLEDYVLSEDIAKVRIDRM